MQITIIDVSQNTLASKTGKTFEQLEVAYKNDQGQTQSKKLVSFSNPEVFKVAKTWEKGAVVDIRAIKNEKTGYWDWIGFGQGDAPVATTTGSTAPTRVTGSTYETKEERAARQILIVRQSSISSAVELLGPGKSVADIIATAKQFEEYVFGQENNTDEDVPN
jgi:hypothetical protein